MLHLIAIGASEEAKKKFTFKPSILYIEDINLFDTEYSEQKRADFLKQIQQSMEYAKFKVYFSLLENVILEKLITKLNSTKNVSIIKVIYG